MSELDDDEPDEPELLEDELPDDDEEPEELELDELEELEELEGLDELEELDELDELVGPGETGVSSHAPNIVLAAAPDKSRRKKRRSVGLLLLPMILPSFEHAWRDQRTAAVIQLNFPNHFVCGDHVHAPR
jgi:hypothetical protein